MLTVEDRRVDYDGFIRYEGCDDCDLARVGKMGSHYHCATCHQPCSLYGHPACRPKVTDQ